MYYYYNPSVPFWNHNQWKSMNIILIQHIYCTIHEIHIEYCKYYWLHPFILISQKLRDKYLRETTWFVFLAALFSLSLSTLCSYCQPQNLLTLFLLALAGNPLFMKMYHCFLKLIIYTLSFDFILNNKSISNLLIYKQSKPIVWHLEFDFSIEY